MARSGKSIPKGFDQQGIIITIPISIHHVRTCLLSPKLLLTCVSVVFVVSFSQPLHAQSSVLPPRVGLSNLTSSSNLPSLYSPDINGKLPSIKPGRVVGQFAAGTLLGGLSGFLTGIVAVELLQCSGSYYCEFGEFAIGASAGYVLGSSLGVYAVGNDTYQKGSYGITLLGDVAGLGMGIFLHSRMIEKRQTPLRVIAEVTSLFALPVAGAIVGYYLSRKPRNHDAFRSSLVQINDSGINLSAPAVYVSKISFHDSKAFPEFSLLNIRL